MEFENPPNSRTLSAMEEEYYRKAKQKAGIVPWLSKQLKKRHVVLVLLVVLPVLSFLLFGNRGILERYALERDKQEMQGKIRQAQRETARLQQLSKALDSDGRAIEKVAREKYGMVRDGETVYKVKKEK